ncbi:MAG: hypothetical protein H6742_18405 [Alphaproteobacteria bacterium]|nr:hypothetical protein [Alphaproteobacteria bacterium]
MSQPPRPFVVDAEARVVRDGISLVAGPVHVETAEGIQWTLGPIPHQSAEELSKAVHGGQTGVLVVDDSYLGIESSGEEGDFQLDRVLITGSESNFASAKLSGSAQRCRQRIRDQAPHMAGLVLKGFQILLWPRWSTRADGSMGRDWAPTKLGQTVYRIQKIDDETCRVLWLGSQELLPDEDRTDLVNLFSLLSGRLLTVVCHEEFDESGALLNRDWIPTRGTPGGQGPLGYRDLAGPNPHIGYVAAQLWEKYRVARATHLLDVAIHHAFSAQAAVLEARFAGLSIAFETLSSAHSRAAAGGETSTYLDRREFRKAMKPVIKQAKSALLAHGADQATVASIEGKLWAANNRAMQDRFKRMLNDLGLNLTAAEEEVLLRRNAAIHEGVLDRNRESIDVARIFTLEGVLQTLVMRVALALLGFDGMVVDYGAPGWPMVDIHRRGLVEDS